MAQSISLTLNNKNLKQSKLSNKTTTWNSASYVSLPNLPWLTPVAGISWCVRLVLGIIEGSMVLISWSALFVRPKGSISSLSSLSMPDTKRKISWVNKTENLMSLCFYFYFEFCWFIYFLNYQINFHYNLIYTFNLRISTIWEIDIHLNFFFVISSKSSL